MHFAPRLDFPGGFLLCGRGLRSPCSRTVTATLQATGFKDLVAGPCNKPGGASMGPGGEVGKVAGGTDTAVTASSIRSNKATAHSSPPPGVVRAYSCSTLGTRTRSVIMGHQQVMLMLNAFSLRAVAPLPLVES